LEIAQIPDKCCRRRRLFPHLRDAGAAVLPDGIFSNQKSQFGKILEGLRMEKVGIFRAHLEYARAGWYILWPFGNLVAIWYICHRFGTLCQGKSVNPVAQEKKCENSSKKLRKFVEIN
jgi:hypothetical protein